MTIGPRDLSNSRYRVRTLRESALSAGAWMNWTQVAAPMSATNIATMTIAIRRRGVFIPGLHGRR